MEPTKPTPEANSKISTALSGDSSIPFISVMAKDPSEVGSSVNTVPTPASEPKKETAKVPHKIIWTKQFIYLSLTLLTLLVIGNIAWSAYQTIQYQKKIQSLQGSYEENLAELNALKASSSESAVLLSSLYTTLSNVITEEKAKNDSIEAKLGVVSTTVGSLDKLSKSDPQLLKKYSKVYFLNENYTPMSLVVLSPEHVYNTKATYQFHSEAEPFLDKLLDAAKTDGRNLLIISAYRSFATQANVKKINVIRFGTTQANQFSAEQGFSEHQLGTTVDFTTPATGDNFNKFEATLEYQWLKNNAYKYGFVLSYPKNNAYYAYEPWHWRFVGIELASQLHSQEKYFYDYDQRVIDGYLTKMFDK